MLTFTLSPADRHEGALLWAKVALISYSAVLLPLSQPREYVPLDPTDPQPSSNPEQTTSLVSLTTYAFLDKYIFQAYRQGRLEYDQLPPLADYDYTKNLVKRSFKHLDMFSGAPNQHMFIALMKVFCELLK